MTGITAADHAIGTLIRDLRKRKGMTLQALADNMGRSVGFVSQIERDLSRPTVDDMTTLAGALGVPATYFYPPSADSASTWVTRSAERRAFNYARGIVDHLVSPALSSRFFMLETLLEPGANTGDRDLVDSSENAGYVLEGQLTIWLESEQMTLEPGDAFQFPSGSRTRYANLSEKPAKILWVYC